MNTLEQPKFQPGDIIETLIGERLRVIACDLHGCTVDNGTPVGARYSPEVLVRMTTEERCTRNGIRNSLAAHAALVLLYDSCGDERGLELARTLEKEAHAAWVGLGYPDCTTWDLAQHVAE